MRYKIENGNFFQGSRLIATLRADIYDAHGSKLGSLDGRSVRDDHGRVIANVRGSSVMDQHFRKLVTTPDLEKLIDVDQNALLAALWVLCIREND